MPGNHRGFFRRKLAFDHVQIGAADSAHFYADEDFAGAGCGVGRVGEFKRVALDRRGGVEQTSLHRVLRSDVTGGLLRESKNPDFWRSESVTVFCFPRATRNSNPGTGRLGIDWEDGLAVRVPRAPRCGRRAWPLRNRNSSSRTIALPRYHTMQIFSEARAP